MKDREGEDPVKRWPITRVRWPCSRALGKQRLSGRGPLLLIELNQTELVTWRLQLLGD